MELQSILEWGISCSVPFPCASLARQGKLPATRIHKQEAEAIGRCSEA